MFVNSSALTKEDLTLWRFQRSDVEAYIEAQKRKQQRKTQ